MMKDESSNQADRLIPLNPRSSNSKFISHLSEKTLDDNKHRIKALFEERKSTAPRKKKLYDYGRSNFTKTVSELPNRN